MAAPVRAVLVGCGGIAGGWLQALAAMKNVSIVGLADINPAAAEGMRARFKLSRAAAGADLRAMLRSLRPDAVFNCTVPEAHRRVTLDALEHGCHVLGEKPLADTMAHAREMVAAAAKAGRIFAVIQNRRYLGSIRAVRRFLASGKIGRITTVTSDFYIGAHFGGFRDVMEHVLLLDMAIHTFDAARYLSGADPLSVSCLEWNPPGSWYAHGASAAAAFEMTGGIVYSYRGSWCAEGVNTSWESSWRIVGDKGSLVWDGGREFRAERTAGADGFIRARKDLTVRFPAPAPWLEGHAGNIREFVRCVRTGARPMTDAADNIKSLAMVFGAIESAKKRRTVPIAV